MKAVFLDLATVGPDDLSLQPLEQLPLSWSFYQVTRPGEVADRIRDADIIVSNKCVLDAPAILSSSQVSYISAAATGYNHIDVNAAASAGIPVSNVRNYATHSVVQHVYALILSLSTRLQDYTGAVRRGQWEKSDNFCLLDYPIEEVSGKSLGIVGYGVLGRAVAAVAPALGMRVLVARSLTGEHSAERLPLNELLAQSDIISLHVPLTQQTRNLIGQRELSLMKPGALLINAARGGIVDEAALAHALKQGVIGGAGIDVLSKEPPVQDNPLLQSGVPNLLLTPHTAWASRQARQTLINELKLNIEAYLGGSVRNQVS
jgi:glycerate dehydrogenase